MFLQSWETNLQGLQRPTENTPRPPDQGRPDRFLGQLPGHLTGTDDANLVPRSCRSEVKMLFFFFEDMRHTGFGLRLGFYSRKESRSQEEHVSIYIIYNNNITVTIL